MLAARAAGCLALYTIRRALVKTLFPLRVVATLNNELQQALSALCPLTLGLARGGGGGGGGATIQPPS